MNLHSIVAPIIGVVNPNITVQIGTGTGSTTAPDGTRTPVYTAGSMLAQIQALTGKDLRQIENIGQQGTLRAIYLYGDVTGLIRASQQNGSLLKLPDGSVWMVFAELEPWSITAGWCKVAVVQQQASVWPS